MEDMNHKIVFNPWEVHSSQVAIGSYESVTVRDECLRWVGWGEGEMALKPSFTKPNQSNAMHYMSQS